MRAQVACTSPSSAPPCAPSPRASVDVNSSNNGSSKNSPMPARLPPGVPTRAVVPCRNRPAATRRGATPAEDRQAVLRERACGAVRADRWVGRPERRLRSRLQDASLAVALAACALRAAFPAGDMPAIEVYEVGRPFFVSDGHHRTASCWSRASACGAPRGGRGAGQPARTAGVVRRVRRIEVVERIVSGSSRFLHIVALPA
jgi:hypothetical protein